jgi:hypothetical protein
MAILIHARLNRSPVETSGTTAFLFLAPLFAAGQPFDPVMSDG